jgi:hypothetical protein
MSRRRYRATSALLAGGLALTGAAGVALADTPASGASSPLTKPHHDRE